MTPLDEETRVCRKCFTKAPLTSAYFYRAVSKKGGFQYRCKPCAKAAVNGRYHKDPIRHAEYRFQNEDKIRDTTYRRLFGITIDQYQEFLENQGNCCAICKKSQRHTGRRFAVDHNHHTGKVRGLLCEMCNRGLGHFMADYGPEFLEEAIKYLKEKQ